jgi:hypothetical protein
MNRESKEVRGGEREWSRIKEAHLEKNLLQIFISHISMNWKGFFLKEEMLKSLVMYEDFIPKIYTGQIFCFFLYVFCLNTASSVVPQIPFCLRMLGPNPGLLRLWQWQLNALTTRLDLIHN